MIMMKFTEVASWLILQEWWGEGKKGNSSLDFLPVKLDKGLEILYLSFWAVWKCQLMIIEYLSTEDELEYLF